jgi:tungstate transport system substrate-binding protein
MIKQLMAVLAAALILAPAHAAPVLKMSTTTSTENSGLLKVLLPAFEAQTGIHVQVISVGTGKALELAKNGDVDVTLVHARAAEDRFVAEGHGVGRRDVMVNDFILVGPASDPDGLKGSRDLTQALQKIIAGKARFIGRGDDSGTDQMEKAYWTALAARPAPAQYVSAGLGMGEVLNMAAEMQAYTLTDRATYAAYKARTGLAVAFEGDPRMFNPYGIIAVNPRKYPAINYQGAMRLIEWITSAQGRATIAGYRVDGQQLFFPTAAGK